MYFGDTEELWFGLRPPEGYDGVAWGARAIYSMEDRVRPARRGFAPMRKSVPSIDLVPDRQSWTGAPDDRRAMSAWVNKKGMKLLERALTKEFITPDTHDAVVVRGDGYVMKASPRGSYGYLYIVCWQEAGGLHGCTCY
jgi:hypothetical protein